MVENTPPSLPAQSHTLTHATNRRPSPTERESMPKNDDAPRSISKIPVRTKSSSPARSRSPANARYETFIFLVQLEYISLSQTHSIARHCVEDTCASIDSEQRCLSLLHSRRPLPRSSPCEERSPTSTASHETSLAVHSHHALESRSLVIVDRPPQQYTVEATSTLAHRQQ